MTLAVAVITPQVAFVGADRRYSGVSRLKNFRAAKICCLETTDAQGLITFAGVGARAGKTTFELSNWITRVLRGYSRTLDQSLNAIAEAATEQKLHKLVEGHAFGFAGFKEGKMSLQIVTSAPELFSWDLTGKSTKLSTPSSSAPFRVYNINIPQDRKVFAIILGSGASFVPPRAFIDLSRQARRVRRKEMAGERWAVMWSWINRRVAMQEPTVGPEVMCAWRYCGGGGNHSSHAANGSRQNNSGNIPSISRGMPIGEIAERLLNHIMSKNNPMDTMREMNQEITDKLMEGLETNPRTKF